MQSDDVFCDMINSIQFLNMSKMPADEGMSVNFGDSGFNSGAEMNADNIFFYEDSCPSLQSVSVKTEPDDAALASNFACDHQLPSPSFAGATSASADSRVRHRAKREKEYTQIQVNVGIDEDLKMILEMDPSLMDDTGSMEKAVEPASQVADAPKVTGLPPKM